jgi:hypothetical protein
VGSIITDDEGLNSKLVEEEKYSNKYILLIMAVVCIYGYIKQIIS